MRGDPEPAAGPTAAVAIIAALSFERAPLDAFIAYPRSPLRVYQSGIGGQRAYDAARSALAAGTSALVSWGVAGGLVSGLEPGSVVMPEKVVTASGEEYPTDAPWRKEICRRLRPLLPVHEGNIFDSSALLRTSDAKAHAASMSGAIAADMESAAVGRAARSAGKPFIVFRVVLDTLSDTLPRGIERWIDPAGNRRPFAGLGSIVRPKDWSNLIRLSRRYRRASRSLSESARVLVPHDLFHPQLGG